MHAKNPSRRLKNKVDQTRRFTPRVSLLEDRTTPATFFVDPAFTGLAPGTSATYNNYPGQTPIPGVIVGTDGFASINAALAAAAGNGEADTLNLAGTTHKLNNSAGTVVVNGDTVSIVGSGKTATIVQPTNNTAAISGVSAGFVSVLQAANAGTVLNLSSFTFDGLANATKIGRAVQYVAGAAGTINDVTIQNVVFGPDGYGITAQNQSKITVTNSLLQNIGRAGITVSASTATIQSNIITGQTAQNRVNYGIQIANLNGVGNSTVNINANTITNHLGGAADSSGNFLLSAGIFSFTNTNTSPTIDIFGNNINNNQTGVLVDSNATANVDSSDVFVYANNFAGTANQAVSALTSSSGNVPAPSNFFSPGGAPVLNGTNGITQFVNVGNSSRNEPVPVIPASTPQEYSDKTGIPIPPPLSTTQFGAGAGGGAPRVTSYNAAGTAIGTVNTGFASSFTGGVRVYQADFNGDGFVDSAVGTGPGVVGQVQVISGKDNTTVLQTYTPFGNDFTGGVFVAAADLNGDGTPDLIISPDQTGGPRVRVFNGITQNTIVDYFGIDDAAFRGGVRLGVGDVNGDGTPDILVSAGFTGGPRVTIWSGAQLAAGNVTNSAVLANFFAFEQGLRNGTYASASDLNLDGRDDPIFGAGPGGGPRVRVADATLLLSTQNVEATGVTIGNFFAGPDTFRGGVRVLGRDLDANGIPEIITGSGEGTTNNIQIYNGNDVLTSLSKGVAPTPTANFSPFGNGVVLADGVYVG